MMDKIRIINKTLKWILVIGFLVLVCLSIKYGFNNCSKCSLEFEGEEINHGDVWELYMDKCLTEFTAWDGNPIEKFNLTVKGCQE